MSQLTFRPATLDDAELASDLMTAAYPPQPEDPVMTRYRWERPRDGFVYRKFIVEKSDQPIAYTAFYHGPWGELPERHCEVEVYLDRAQLGRDLLNELWTWTSDQAVTEGAAILLAYAAEDEPEMLESLAGLGFERDRLERVWMLDLQVAGAVFVGQAAEARDRFASAGIQFLTLADWRDERKFEKLYELDSITRQDIPHSLPILKESLEDFRRRNQAPDRPAARTWIALEDGGPVAMSYLKYPPVRGLVWTGYTCVHPSRRGRGLARGVKLQSLAQGVELGVPRVGSDNDSENVAMLHINETLGYQPWPGYVGHLKRVRKNNNGQ